MAPEGRETRDHRSRHPHINIPFPIPRLVVFVVFVVIVIVGDDDLDRGGLPDDDGIGSQPSGDDDYGRGIENTFPRSRRVGTTARIPIIIDTTSIVVPLRRFLG